MPNQYKNKVIYGDSVLMDITDTTAEAGDVASGQVFYAKNGARTVGTFTQAQSDWNESDTTDPAYILNKPTIPGQATDLTLGTVKLNSTEGIDVNSSGQLTVGGRLGQFSSQDVPNGGLYFPTSNEPEMVSGNSLLITEATLVGLYNSRIFALAGGVGVTCNSAAAGSTQYIVNNTFNNRFTCAAAKDGYAALNQTGAGTLVAKVLSVKLQNGNDFVPYSGADEANNKIVITLDRTVNPDAATTQIRLYGAMYADSSVHIGQNIGTSAVSGKGKILELGQNILSKESNSICVGNSIYNDKNQSSIFGSNHINRVQGACLTGQGHDSSSGTKVGLTAHGKYSNITANTVFAIGDGTSNTVRSNIFEITDDSGVTGLVLKSANGTTHKISVDNNGAITSLSALSDTNISSPSAGQALVYDGTSSKWVNASVSASDIGAIPAPQAPSEGQILTYQQFSQGEYGWGVTDLNLELNDTSAIFYELEPTNGGGFIVEETFANIYQIFSSTRKTYFIAIDSSTGYVCIFTIVGVNSYTQTISLLSASNVHEENFLRLTLYADNEHNLMYGSISTITVPNLYDTTLQILSDTTISNPSSGQVLTYDGTSSKWINSTLTLPSASSSAPLVDGASAVVGTSTAYARADHVHPKITQTISMSNNVITLTGSDGSTSSVTLPVYDGTVTSGGES